MLIHVFSAARNRWRDGRSPTPSTRTSVLRGMDPRRGRGLNPTFALLMAIGAAVPTSAIAQTSRADRRPETAAVSPGGAAIIDSLVAQARAINPRIRAARDRVVAARARIGPAGARPDPMLMAGIQNFPISEPGFQDFMTMKMVGIGQTIPYPGKLSLRRRAAEGELQSAQANLDAATLAVSRDTKAAYYDLAYADRALDIVERNRLVLLDFMKVTEARYGVGTGGQQDVLRARVEAARLGEAAATLREERRAVLARLNAILDQSSETPLERTAIPRRIVQAAVVDSGVQVRFASPTLGARAADSPLPPLAVLQDLAVRLSPVLRSHEAMIAAQVARVELAHKEYLPDFDVSLQYGQRQGLSDMVSAVVSIPIPLQKGRKQDQLVAEATAELSAREAEHHEQVNAIRAEVARLCSDLERDRTQLALYVKAILPQARASLASATASYPVGRVDLLTLLDNQTTLFNYETAYYRALTHFGKTLAELELVVGQEVLP